MAFKMTAFDGWLASTVLLWLFNRNDDSSSDTDTQKADLLNENNTTKIGSAIPACIGRCMVKEPLVSYFGDFRADIYTEEYGMHTGIDWRNIVPMIVLGIIAICSTPDEEKGTVISGEGAGGEVIGTVTTSGHKRAMMLNVVVQVLLWILMQLFASHQGRTTIQKGFKYYLGWQMIICWSHPNIGIKKIWMNVYDSDLEQSTQQGIWSDNNATLKDNPAGIVAHIDKPDMFGGVDEGGGFVGDIRIYFGGNGNTHDSWMVNQMSLGTVQEEVRGLTPLYRPYLTAVIPQAYIGKQSNIPSMWFEIINYPTGLADRYSSKLQIDYDVEKSELQAKIDEIEKIAVINRTAVQNTNLTSYKVQMDSLVKRGALHLGKIGEDSNPAEAIFEICTNKNWGCDIEEDKIDIDSLYEVGKTCEKESMGVSLQISQITPARTVIGAILSHINGMCYDDAKTGKLKFKLIRNDYDESKLLTLTTTNCVSCEFSRLDWSETASSVTASFTDAEDNYETNTVPYYDLANVKITKTNKDKQIDATYFTTPANAKTYAQNELLTAGYPLAAASIKANRQAHTLAIGDPFILKWEPYGITKTIMRVTDIDYAGLEDGTISIEAIEDVFSFDKTLYEFSSGTGWTEVDHLPEQIIYRKFIETPYEMNMTLDTYVYAMAINPSVYSVYWDVWRNKGGNYYISTKSSDWTAGAKLIYGTEANYTSDDKIEVKELGSLSRFDTKIRTISENTDLYNNTTGRNIAIIDDEIISYNNIVRLPNGDYSIQGIIRGIYDTIPSIHTSGSVVYLLDTMLNITGNKALVTEGKIASESLCVTSETVSKQADLDTTTAYNITTTRRSEQPSVMANLKFGADCGDNTVVKYDNTERLSNDLKFVFNQRDKFKTYSIISQDTTTYRGIDIVTDTNTNNVVKVTYGSDSREYLFNAYESNNFVLNWNKICEVFTIKDSMSINLKIGTYDTVKKLYSNQMYSKDIIMEVPSMVGIVKDKKEAQIYADSIVDDSYVIIPESAYNISRTILYNLCPMIMTYSYTEVTNANGSKTDVADTGIIMGQDGNSYNLTTKYYRIVGKDSNGKAILYEMTLDKEYVFKTYFNTKVGNYVKYYKYNTDGVWEEISVKE